MRHVKIRPGSAMDSHALGELIERACLDTKQRLLQTCRQIGSFTTPMKLSGRKAVDLVGDIPLLGYARRQNFQV